MANEEQLSILKQGVEAWNKWRNRQREDFADVDLSKSDLSGVDLRWANMMWVNLKHARMHKANLEHANFEDANLKGADLTQAILLTTNFHQTSLIGANLEGAYIDKADLWGALLTRCNFSMSEIAGVYFHNLDLSDAIGLDSAVHVFPSSISTDTFRRSKGNIPAVFLRGCGLNDWDVEAVKLYNPELSNEEINKTLYKIFDLRASRALQISPLFISYSHGDSPFVDKLEVYLHKRGIRFWRDIHDMKSGRMEKQIDRALRLNPTVLLILSEHSLQSDWVEHEVRIARTLEKELKRDVLCPVALDDSWKNSLWAKRIMEQIMEYNILDFSEWKDDTKFESPFNKLIDGLELFYK